MHPGVREFHTNEKIQKYGVWLKEVALFLVKIHSVLPDTFSGSAIWRLLWSESRNPIWRFEKNIKISKQKVQKNKFPIKYEIICKHINNLFTVIWFVQTITTNSNRLKDRKKVNSFCRFGTFRNHHQGVCVCFHIWGIIYIFELFL